MPPTIRCRRVCSIFHLLFCCFCIAFGSQLEKFVVLRNWYIIFTLLSNAFFIVYTMHIQCQSPYFRFIWPTIFKLLEAHNLRYIILILFCIAYRLHLSEIFYCRFFIACGLRVLLVTLYCRWFRLYRIFLDALQCTISATCREFIVLFLY